MAEFTQEVELHAALRGARYRCDYGRPCKVTGKLPEQIVGVIFMPDAEGPDAEGIDYMLDGVRHALEIGGSFVLLAQDRKVWSRCRSIIEASMIPAGGGLQ